MSPIGTANIVLQMMCGIVPEMLQKIRATYIITDGVYIA